MSYNWSSIDFFSVSLIGLDVEVISMANASFLLLIIWGIFSI